MAELASLVVSPIVDKIVESVSSLIKEEYLLLSGVGEQVKRLSSSLTAIQGVLEDAQKKQLNNASLRDWLGKLKNTALDAGDTLDLYITEAYLWRKKQQQQRTFRSPFTKVSYTHDAAHNMKKICERIEMIAKEREMFHLDVSTRPANPERPHTITISSVDISDVVGREDDKEKIVDVLLSDQDHGGNPLNVIPIIGMGGLGKTTLAQLVFSDQRIINHFEFRMWVCVTIKFDLTRILKEIIEYLSKMRYDINLSKDQLVSRLLDIMKGKHFLLVLDDVWTENHLQWKELQGFLKLGENGSSVLVTSRSIKVSNAMGTKPPHLLSNLPEEECWSLFKKFAFNSTVESTGVPTNLEKIGREIVSKCNGLPLAVKAMGGLLHGNDDVREWQIISNSEIWEIEQDLENDHQILPALKLSYDHLPSHLKECFAYCSIFPKAYVFDKKELVKLWMAEELIKSREQVKPEDTGNNYFNELSFKSFFQLFNVESKERYRMHDLMHDLAKSISIPHCCQVKDINTCNTAENTRHLSILCTDVEQPVLKIIGKSKKLRTLLLPGEYLKDLGKTTLNNLFHAFRYMRVLDLSSSSIVELPEAVEKLKLLRYLDLSRTEIRMLPNSICNLINLQTLKLLGCLWLFVLPSDLGNLSNLRHLELDEMFWYKTSTLPPRLGGLTSLHNLNAFRVGRDKGYGIDELKGMSYLMGTLHISDLQNVVDDAREAKLREKESLHKVVFEWSSSSDVTLQQDHEAAQEKVLDELQPHSNIKDLQLRNYKGHRLAPWIRDGLLQNLVSISFKHCTKCRTLSLGQLPHLVQLFINGMPELEEWPEVECLSLQRLKVSNCPKLNQLPFIFSNLRSMKIKRCDSLKALTVTPSLNFLILVDNPALEDWHRMQETLCSYKHLVELKIVNCNNLRALPKMLFFPQKLEISGCKLLSALPTPQFAKRLQHLALGPCHDGTLVKAIPSTSSLYSLVISGISNVISLSKWPRLPGLKALYIRECKDLVSLLEGEEGGGGDEKEEKEGREGDKKKKGEGGEGSLKFFVVSEEDVRSYIYFSSLEEEEEEEEKWLLRSLASLKLLSIRNCPKLEQFPSQGLPTTLECLIIGSCPNLKLLGPNEMLNGLTSLKDLYVEDCPNLQSLPENGLPTSLQHLHIKGCPLLAKRCQKENGGGLDWPKIMHVPDIEIDYTIISSVTNSLKNMQAPNTIKPPSTIKPSKPKVSSTTWIPQFMCGRETDIKEEGKQKKQTASQSGLGQKDKGKFSKGKMTQGESSSSASQKK